MTPAARYAAAIDILDEIVAGTPTERALTNWARRSRFAGSGDRAAIRDVVFDTIRRLRSSEWLGGGRTGRALVLGCLRASGRDPGEVFTGVGHAPRPLDRTEIEGVQKLGDAPRAIRLDVQDWLLPRLDEALGAQTDEILIQFKERAPVFLRADLSRASLSDIQASLAADGIETEPHPLASTALQVTEGARRVAGAAAYADGLIELQDAASQAVVDEVFDIRHHPDVLDYCAGGGGKALAFAAAGAARVVAHDALPDRMNDVPKRAARAGANVKVQTSVSGRYPLVFCDVPCSGSGAWRRQPDAKWRLDEPGLADLLRLQDSILDRACVHVSPGGTLAVATCSLLREENELRAEAFVARNPAWRIAHQRRLSPLEGGDGFFVVTFRERAQA